MPADLIAAARVTAKLNARSDLAAARLFNGLVASPAHANRLARLADAAGGDFDRAFFAAFPSAHAVPDPADFIANL